VEVKVEECMGEYKNTRRKNTFRDRNRREMEEKVGTEVEIESEEKRNRIGERNKSIKGNRR